MDMPAVVVVDDDKAVIQLATRGLTKAGIRVFAAGSADEAFRILADRLDEVDACLLDILLPDASGLDVFKRIYALDPKLPVLFITGSTSSDVAIEAMKLGAFDYVTKPLNLPSLIEVVQRAIDIRHKMSLPAPVDEEIHAKEGRDLILGNSPAMGEVYKAIGRVAEQDVSVLIEGESGTGKELVAQAIYHHSHRADQPFLAVNCAAIPETLLESELFGHEKGAFTGADRRHIGKFEQCSGGTIFLDEIGDMPRALQGKILRILQSHEFERVGGNETIRTDVRVIAATNQNLEQMVAHGDFREDLYYRLKGFLIRVPPLRERGQDLVLLLEHFLARFNAELGKDVEKISNEALDILLRYRWPGNVRELENVVKQAILQATGSVIVPHFLPNLDIHCDGLSGEPPSAGGGEQDLAVFIERRIRSRSEDLYAEAVTHLERQLLRRVLEATGGNQSRASRMLGITRGSLRNKIRALDICIEPVVSVGAHHAAVV
jgi:two-component system nitrogen regulation response regulator GlnG